MGVIRWLDGMQERHRGSSDKEVVGPTPPLTKQQLIFCH